MYYLQFFKIHTWRIQHREVMKKDIPEDQDLASCHSPAGSLVLKSAESSLQVNPRRS